MLLSEVRDRRFCRCGGRFLWRFYHSLVPVSERPLLCRAGSHLLRAEADQEPAYRRRNQPVVLWNVRNTLENLRGLAKSLLCNLEAKKILVDLAPLSNYVQMLRWVGGQLKHFTDFGAGELRSEFKLSASADSVVFKQKLSEAKQVLNQTAVSALAAMNMTSSVAQKLLPALGILLLVLLTARYVKKYRTDRGFQNIFITDALLRYDEQQRAEGKPSIFPLTEKEKKRYISIPSSRPSAKEGKAMLKFGFPVFTNLLIWLFFIGIDALVYWLIGVLRTRLEELEPFQIPVIMHLKVSAEGKIMNVTMNRFRSL